MSGGYGTKTRKSTRFRFLLKISRMSRSMTGKGFGNEPKKKKIKVCSTVGLTKRLTKDRRTSWVSRGTRRRGIDLYDRRQFKGGGKFRSVYESSRVQPSDPRTQVKEWRIGTLVPDLDSLHELL